MKTLTSFIQLYIICFLYVSPLFANASAPTINSPGDVSSPGPTLSTLTPQFTWSAATGATGYGLYIRDVTTNTIVYPNSSGTTSTPLTGTSFNLPSGYLVNGHAYRWAMTSFTNSFESAQSSYRYFQTPVANASAPTINSPGDVSSPGPTLSTLTPQFTWSAATGATGYGLYIRDVTTNTIVYPNSSGTTSTPLTGTSFNLPSGYLVNGHAYRWAMTSFTNSFESAQSSYRYFQTPVANASAPTINSPGDVSSPGPTLSILTPQFTWSAATGATGYGLYIRDVTTNTIVYPNSSGTTSTPLTGTSFNLPSGYLVNGHAYRWAMTSFTNSFESAQSSYRYFQTPVANASAPTINSPGDVSSPGPTLSILTPQFTWSAATGATGYGLYIRDVTTNTIVYPNSSGTTSTPLTGTSFNLPSGYLVNGHAYRWAMTSFTNSFESAQSSYLYFQTPANAPTTVFGIDVSQNNTVSDWTQVQNAGKSFAFIKASSGLLSDYGSTLASYVSIIHSNHLNILVGAYHFAYPNYTVSNTGTAEAKHFLNNAGNWVGQGYLPPALDIEDGAIDGGSTWVLSQHLTSDTLVAWIEAWISEVQRQKPGVVPIIYTTGYYVWFLSTAQRANDLSNYPLWIATYYNSDPTSIPTSIYYNSTSTLAPWTNWKFQQYASDPTTQKTSDDLGGKCPGAGNAQGYCDLDSYIGDLTSLQSLIALPVELSSFTGSYSGSKILLNWRTETEVHNYGFDIERRIAMDSSSQWNKIAFVAGSGTSNSPHEYSYIDQGVSSGKYGYRLKQINNDGTFNYYGNAEVDILPQNYSLSQNYPNPFNPSTTIRYVLPQKSNVKIQIFNTIGQQVVTLVEGEMNAGFQQAQWNASNVASGIYFYRLIATPEEGGGKPFVEVKKMQFLK